MLPTALQLLPAVIWGIGSLFVVESPRYLLSANRKMETVRSLERLRKLPIDHPLVAAELDAMQSQIDYETESVAVTSVIDMLEETMGSVENRRRFMLMFMAHTFGQCSGANAITQYSPTIFGYVNVPCSTRSSAVSFTDVVTARRALRRTSLPHHRRIWIGEV